MANEILLSGLGDQRLSEVMSADYIRLFADRTSLPNHPALVKAGSITGQLSNVIKTPHVGLDGYDILASVAEGSSITNSALSDGSTQVTVGTYGKRYQASDLARITDAQGRIRPDVLVRDSFMAYQHTMVSLIAGLMGGFSNVVGSSGVNATLEDLLEGKAALESSNVEGPYLAILHSRQWNDITIDMALNIGGAAQWLPATAEMIQKWGPGYKGNYAGIDIFVTNRVPTANAGADRAGGMFGRGAVVWGEGSPLLDDPTQQLLIGDRVLFERQRDASARLTAYVTTGYLGVAEAIDAGGVAIITDA